MKFLPYLLKHLRRNWLRTLSTVLAMALCIFLFCVLETVIDAVNFGLQSASASRLVTRHAVSLVFNLPLSYKERIAGLAGVKSVSTSSWFGGLARREERGAGRRERLRLELGHRPDFSKFFANLAVDPEAYLDMYPEYILNPEERQALLAGPAGLPSSAASSPTGSAGRWGTASSWRASSRPTGGQRPLRVRGEGHLRRGPRAIPRHRRPPHVLQLQVPLRGARAAGRPPGSYAVEIADPRRRGRSARRSTRSSRTPTRRRRRRRRRRSGAGFVSLAGNLALLLSCIGLAVTFTILLVTANTMSLAVRERRTEIAVLKTLGFRARQVMGLVLGEALLIGALGGAVGLCLAPRHDPRAPVAALHRRRRARLPQPRPAPSAVGGLGFGLALALGGSRRARARASSAYRARITDMLRQV